jgi:predicted aminopeptidase
MMPMLTETPARRGGACRLLLALVCALLPGCGSLYVMQAANGEMQVLRARVPIDRLLADPATPADLRARLEQVRAARAFASGTLGLPDNRSYRTYADIRRQYVVWNVVATPEFSVLPLHWCFPVAGCVAYRGYFHEDKARAFANELAVRGDDVAIDGVPAYSTLGRFADPVLSSMLPYGDDELAATIFHELAHQLIYVQDDSAFNEAFATTVEEVGLERWLTQQGQAARIEAFRADQRHEQAFVELFTRTRAELVTLYASALPPVQMRARKAAVMHRLGSEIQALERREHAEYPLYDEWIAQGLNNARLAAVATYFDCVPGFQHLLLQQQGDLGKFYAAVRELARLPRAQRHARVCSGPLAPEDEDS